MESSTASSIASGVGPLLAALIAAYQLWLKPRIEQEREVPFDPIRRSQLAQTVRNLRLQLLLFTAFVAAAAAIPVGASILSLAEIDPKEPVALPKVLVAFVAIVGVIHVVYLAGRLRTLWAEVRRLSGA